MTCPLREVVDVAVVVKLQAVFVAMCLEKVYDPLLLFGCEQSLAVVVTVVCAMAAKVLLDCLA